MALRKPPSRAIIRSPMLAGKARVPLNIMCSTQWLLPVTPGRSKREPTRYHTHHEITGAMRTSLSTTVKPFFKRVLITLGCFMRKL